MSRAKFNVGDIVLVVGYQEDIDQMKKLLGKALDIQYVSKHGDGPTWYLAGGWHWREDWLELLKTRESIEEML